MVTIDGINVPEAYIDGLWKLKTCGKLEESRNGPVLSIPNPVLLTIHNPWERVLIDNVRQPNPYFHLAEFVWMMAGSRDAKWLSGFNSNMMSFSDDGTVFKAAYGHRWRKHFKYDQIKAVIGLLRRDPETRRACIGIWDSNVDHEQSKDIPCNTHIYFRMRDSFLEMTVCNRSNDYIWGMMGANCVHMTMLQEFIAGAVGCGVGKYRVFTNNLHIYLNVPRYEEIMATLHTEDVYRRKFDATMPILAPGENPEAFLDDCQRFVWLNDSVEQTAPDRYYTNWFRQTFLPMMRAYYARKMKVDETQHLADVRAEDWREAGFAWRRWKEAA